MKALKDSPKCSVHFKSYGRNEKCLLPSKQCFSPQFSFGTLCLMTPFFLHKSSGNKFDDAKIFLQKLAVISLITPFFLYNSSGNKFDDAKFILQKFVDFPQKDFYPPQVNFFKVHDMTRRRL